MTTRFPYGLTNVLQETVLGNAPFPDPAKVQMVFDDFSALIAGQWTVVETAAGATQAVVAGPGGLILLTNSATIGDVNGFSTNIAIFGLNISKRFWARARFSMLSPADNDFFLGFGDTAAAFNPANGAYIEKVAGVFSVVAETAGARVLSSVPGVNSEFTASVMSTVGLEYDGRGTLTGYVNDRKLASVAITSITGTNMLGFFGLRNVTAFANVATLDHLTFAVER